MLLLPALALQAALLPAPPSVERFPDPSFWPGSGAQQVGNMMAAVLSEAVEPMLQSGPGPQQLLRRWRTEKATWTEDQRVMVLLSGWAFHDTDLVPIYEDALERGSVREKRAAVWGLFKLIGDLPPDITKLRDDLSVWRSVHGLAHAVRWGTSRRSLVGLWVDSYLDLVGQPRRPGVVLKPRRPERCLVAIREVATPADLDEVVALWPQLATQDHRRMMVQTIEAVTGQPFLRRPRGERAPSGGWLYDSAAHTVDGWAGSMCSTVDGIDYLRTRMAAAGHQAVRRGRRRTDAGGADDAGIPALPWVPWLNLLRNDVPPTWRIAVDALTAFGAPAVVLDMASPESPANEEAVRKVRAYFPVSK